MDSQLFWVVQFCLLQIWRVFPGSLRVKLASLALMRACSGYSICTIPFPRGYIMFWRRPQHSLMTPQKMTHTSTYKVCLCKKSARLRARAHRQKHKIQALTMTPTRPTMIRSSFSRPSHDPNPQTNHRTTASTSMATHWRGSARCGARRAANSFVLCKTRNPIYLNWSAFSGDRFKPVL